MFTGKVSNRFISFYSKSMHVGKEFLSLNFVDLKEKDFKYVSLSLRFLSIDDFDFKGFIVLLLLLSSSLH